MRFNLALVITLVIAKNIFAQGMGPYEEFAKIINNIQLQQNSSYEIDKNLMSDDCMVFMNKDNFAGPLGQNIIKLITEKPEQYGYLLHGGSVNKYCPKYSTMLASEKALVWVMIMTVMANFESTCSSIAKGKGPNGMAYGYFQLHQGQESKYVRDSNACPTNASMDPRLATGCALAMLETQMQRTSGDLFSEDSYWDVLKPSGELRKADKIARALYRSSLCNPTVL